MNKPTMNDLKLAILAVLQDAEYGYDCNGNTDFETFIVNRELLYNLQSEYNIYFVEPDEKQVDLI